MFIDTESLLSTERAHVRNMLIDEAKRHNARYVCLLDGDTIMSSKTLSIAYNIFESSNKSVFSAPRLDFDTVANNEQSKWITNEFVSNGKFAIPHSYFSYYDTNNSVAHRIGNTESNFSLASYAFFAKLDDLIEVGRWDENFTGWGEEDVDYTYRLFKNGCNLITPRIEGFLTIHLTHNPEQSSSLIKNATYLLSKHPSMYNIRRNFYDLIGI